jgi:hypothetical protein
MCSMSVHYIIQNICNPQEIPELSLKQLEIIQKVKNEQRNTETKTQILYKPLENCTASY